MGMRELFSRYGIPYATEGEHCTEGWVNIHCPFCSGSRNFHLGITEDGTGANCWRCGPRSVINIIITVLGIEPRRAYELLKKYTGKTPVRKKPKEPKISIFPFKFPEPNMALTKPYLDYLRNRGFSEPEVISKYWSLKQTGPASFLDNISYSYRIIAPIRWDKEFVSFQARDITDRSPRKYMACPQKREKIHHKNILYGRQEYWHSPAGIIVVEGIADVWKLGPYSAATFGIQFKTEQVMKLAKLPGSIFILFDNEKQAQKQARSLQVKLLALGKQAEVLTIPPEYGNDPADMTDTDASYFVKQIIGKGK